MQLGALVQLFLANICLRPLSLLWPKDPSLVAFFPREGHRYIDNVAHLYENLRLEGRLPKKAYLLVTNHPEVARSWQEKDRTTAIFAPKEPRQWLRYLRTGVVVTDSWQWAQEHRNTWFAGAKKVQLWHGIPLKRIELSNLEGSPKLRGLRGILERGLHFLRGRFPRYDLVVSTSPFFEHHAFRRSFRAKKFINAGYPRNDYLFHKQRHFFRVDEDSSTLHQLQVAREAGKKVVVYAPTFRDSGGGPFSDRALDYQRLRAFAEMEKIVFVVKLHPYLKEDPPADCAPHVLRYDEAKDIAPLLKLADMLITDYSSVFFDYLLLNRPIVFFPYDQKKYFKKDRKFLFDYSDMTPGPHCINESELFDSVRDELRAPNSTWKKKRDTLANLSFEKQDGAASLRILEEIERL